MNVPERYERLATTEEVNEQIERLAAEILADEAGKSPLFVSLLHGAAPFASKLMFAIARRSPAFHPDLKAMIVSTYGTEQHASEPHIVTDLPPSTVVGGRDVIVVDDVLDKGITADFVAQNLRIRGAATVRLAVLCDKLTQRERDVKADYIGFTFDDNWLVGMGMDDAAIADEGYRWLEEIWEIRR